MRKLMEALDQFDTQDDFEGGVTYRDHIEIQDYERGDSRDSSGEPRSRDGLRRSTAVGDGEHNRAVVNTESGELLFVGPQDQAEQFVDDLENELEVVELPHRPYCEVWPRESGTYSWFRGTREECEHFIHGDASLDEAWGEGHGDDEEVFFVIVDGDDEAASLVSLTKEGGRWQESLHKGPAPYGFGSKRYMSHLTAEDLEGWLSRDYDYVMGPFDYDDGLAQWREYSVPEQGDSDEWRFDENTAQDVELDDPAAVELDFDDLEFDELDPDDVEGIDDTATFSDQPPNSRIQSGVIRAYRILGDTSVNPVMVLKGLERLADGKAALGPQAKSLALLSGALMNVLGDDSKLNLFLRIIAKVTPDPYD